MALSERGFHFHRHPFAR